MVYVHNGISLCHKKARNLAMCNNADGPGGADSASEISQTEETKPTRFHLYVDAKELNKSTNKTKQKRTDKYRKRNKLPVGGG